MHAVSMSKRIIRYKQLFQFLRISAVSDEEESLTY